MFGDRVVKMIDNLSINVEIGASKGNVPMVYNCACTPEEVKNIGPLMRSALCNYERKTNLMGGWFTNVFFQIGAYVVKQLTILD